MLVDVFRLHSEYVTARDKLHHERGVRFSEQLSQRRNPDLEHSASAVGGKSGPEFLDEMVGTQDSPAAENQHRQQCPFLGRGRRGIDSVDHHLEWPENADSDRHGDTLFPGA
jgi:hypothetical protein